MKIRISRLSIPLGWGGLRIVQLSDLHWSPYLSPRFLRQIQQKTAELKPDLLVFTGDFLCYSKPWNMAGLADFLSPFHAPLGAFAVLGNHDYEKPTGIDPLTGDYTILRRKNGDVKAGLRLLFHKTTPTGVVPPEVKELKPHPELALLLAKSPFRLLRNETVLLEGKFPLTGLGEHSVGDDHPLESGLILAHNPDTFPLVAGPEKILVLSGHTHGAQINLPWIRDRLTLLEHPEYKRGLHQKGGSFLYVNRGLGSAFPLRLFSPPEITLFTV